ncbi:MAG: hypothetical protein WCA77_07815 [Thermoplasmata archaeon]
MSAWGAWFTALVLAVGGILALAHLGLNIDAVISGWVHGLEHTLARPL